MPAARKITEMIFGAPLDPFSKETRRHVVLVAILALEGGLLFVAANTGYLGGPAVLANMAADSWVSAGRSRRYSAAR